jgi:ADP-ribosylglycohydrolase
MKHRNDNFLLRIAQGDAYAMAVEYVKREKHPELYAEALKFERFLQHPTHKKLKPGMYTDDTQMSIANIELLLNTSLSPEKRGADDFRRHFFDVFKRDERDGYSRGFQKLLEECQTVAELKEKIVPNSDKNGAAMRSVPFGVIADPRYAIDLAMTQARVTHDTPQGIASAASVAIMSHFTIHTDLPFEEMTGWCEQYVPSAFAEFWHDWDGPVQGNKNDPADLGVGMNTVWAVCTLLRREKSLMGILQKTIEWGGDTDSVAAIAWGIASARYQDEQLPEFLERDLELGRKYGAAFLKDLGKQLMETYDLR